MKNIYESLRETSSCIESIRSVVTNAHDTQLYIDMGARGVSEFVRLKDKT